MIGDHCLKSWSQNQTVIALSSGEAEFYSLTKGCDNSLGMQSLLMDLGIELDIRVMTDASTGKAIASCRGLGKLRHIATHELWIQDLVLRGKLQIIKIKNVFNSSDLFRKDLGRKFIAEAVNQTQHKFEFGRSEIARQVGLVGDDHGGDLDDGEEEVDEDENDVPIELAGKFIHWLTTSR